MDVKKIVTYVTRDGRAFETLEEATPHALKLHMQKRYGLNIFMWEYVSKREPAGRIMKCLADMYPDEYRAIADMIDAAGPHSVNELLPSK